MASFVFDHVFGDKEHPKPWMNPSPVVILPGAKARNNFNSFEHDQRTYFFVMIFALIMTVSAMLMQVIVSIANSRQREAARKTEENGDAALPSNVTKSAIRDASKMLEIKGSYLVSDIWFTWFYMLYQLFCASLVGYAYFNGELDIKCGMDYELYLAWVGEAILTNFLSVVGSIYVAPHLIFQSPIFEALFSIAPFLSERFNGVQAWLQIGLYIATGSTVGYVCSGLVFLSVLLSSLMLFAEPRYVASIRMSFWCCAQQAMEVDQGSKEFAEAAQKHYETLMTQLHVKNVNWHGWEGRFAEFQLALLKFVDSETQQHKVITTIYGEVPCAIATIIFTIFGEFSLFIALSCLVYVVKVFLLTLVRPYVLCMLADAEEHWEMTRASNLDLVMASRDKFSWFCPWQKRCVNALRIVKDLLEEPEECAAAVCGVGTLLMEVDDDSSAAMIVSYTNFLKEVHSELPEEDTHEGVTVFRQAVTRTMKIMCPGIEKRDIQSPPIQSGGNLGYLPTGNGMEHAEILVKKMSESPTGGEEIHEMLAQYRARYAVLPGSCTKHDDLLIFYSDLEPDDCMAIAQLWQYKIEEFRPADEPLVVFGADFSDKDKGTEFEKKRLVSQCMLGTRIQYVLTPDEKTFKYKEEIEKRSHPLAEFWEAKRESQLSDICQRIKDFKGERIHFYVMAPGKGNIAAILEKLKSMDAWPPAQAQKWRVAIYSGSFNMRSMTKDDTEAIKEFASKSDRPLLDAAKFPFFGQKKYHKWTSSFTTFAPENFPAELNLVAHTILTAGLKMLNDEHNLGLVNPEKLYKKKELTRREAERFEKIKPKYSLEAINEYCKLLQEDFALFSKIEDFKKSTITAFAFESCDSPLADQLVFLLEFMRDRMPECLTNLEPGGWHIHEQGFTSVNMSEASDASACKAIQPVLAEPQNEQHLTILRNKLQEYLVRHLQMLQEDPEEDEEDPANQWKSEDAQLSSHTLEEEGRTSKKSNKSTGSIGSGEVDPLSPNQPGSGKKRSKGSQQLVY